VKKGKRVKVKFPIEYRLLITPKYDDREKKSVTFVALRTVNEFKNFLYEIVVHPEVSERTLRFNIQGLRAPQLTLPGTGPARWSHEFNDLHGAYTVIVSKIERDENIFNVRIAKDKVVVEKSPKTRFVDLVTSEEEW
jgi:hypothetical protein